MSSLEEYEAYALRYGSADTSKAAKYLHYGTYGEPDEPLVADFYFWLLRNGERTVLVDCGYDDVRARARGYRQSHHPLQLLARFGVRPGDVDHVIASHLHFDHIGNLGLFPNATFSVSRDELAFWTGPFADRPFFAPHTEQAEVQTLIGLQREGRVRLVDGVEELFPGITVTPIRGHTPGQLITEVAAAGARVVLASDALHWYEEMERDRPFWVFCDLEGMHKGYAYLNELAVQPGVSVVAGHDPDVMRRFTRVDDDCADLRLPVAPAQGEPV
ncbi:N-acyl homoserine lactonase family protein [Streptomyces sp. NPDC002790]|uniref:N-acyl homoserine lactonase family protein n=1 Tax=Streptomyces sp. NPDC002790 TaxID=3154431 RepID=UPI0033308EE4